MDDAQLLRYSRHILLPELGIDAQERVRRRACAHRRRRRPRRTRPRSFSPPPASARSRFATPTTSTSPTCSARSCSRPRDVGRRKVDAAARVSTPINPEVRDRDRRASASAPDELAPLVAAADVVLDCSDNFATRHAVNRACVAREKAAGLGRGDPLRRPGRGVRHARPRRALLPLPVRRRRGARGDALRDHGRVRAAGRHHRRDAGGRGAEARRAASANRSPAACCCSTRSRCTGASCASRAIPAARSAERRT